MIWKRLELLRFSSQKESTLSILSDISRGRKFLCYGLEDEYRQEKVHSETRIPAGIYTIKLRTVGGFHQRYSEKFPDIHKGMLWLQDVPGFEYILIHCGNDDDDTAGCILVGNTSQENITRDGFIGESTNAYRRIYPGIAQSILDGNNVTINILDFDSHETD